VDLYTLVAMARGALEGRNAAEQTDYQRQQVEQEYDLRKQQIQATIDHNKALLDLDKRRLDLSQKEFDWEHGPADKPGTKAFELVQARREGRLGVLEGLTGRSGTPDTPAYQMPGKYQLDPELSGLVNLSQPTAPQATLPVAAATLPQARPSPTIGTARPPSAAIPVAASPVVGVGLPLKKQPMLPVRAPMTSVAPREDVASQPYVGMTDDAMRVELAKALKAMPAGTQVQLGPTGEVTSILHRPTIGETAQAGMYEAQGLKTLAEIPTEAARGKLLEAQATVQGLLAASQDIKNEIDRATSAAEIKMAEERLNLIVAQYKQAMANKWLTSEQAKQVNESTIEMRKAFPLRQKQMQGEITKTAAETAAIPVTVAQRWKDLDLQEQKLGIDLYLGTREVGVRAEEAKTSRRRLSAEIAGSLEQKVLDPKDRESLRNSLGQIVDALATKASAPTQTLWPSVDEVALAADRVREYEAAHFIGAYEANIQMKRLNAISVQLGGPEQTIEGEGPAPASPTPTGSKRKPGA
jgi:hypothetical protein